MKDIDIKGDTGKFKLRVSAIIINNNKILVHKGKKFNGYCFPGGHVELGETTKEAVIREIKEELEIECEIIDLFCINENIYSIGGGKISQEINYYYRMNYNCEIPPNIANIRVYYKEKKNAILCKG